MKYDYSAVPHELQILNQWVLWKREKNTDKIDKIPYQPTGQRAGSTYPSTWTSFQIAVSTYHNSNEFAGIGFVLSETDNIVVLDFDKCAPFNKNLNGLLRALASFTELSQSKTGLHTFIMGKKADSRCKFQPDKFPFVHSLNCHPLEIYEKERFFALTGEVYKKYTLLKEGQSHLNKIFSCLPKQKPRQRTNAPSPTLSLEDDKVVELFHSARNASEVLALWQGDLSRHHDDHSSADLALCAHLTFYTQNPDQIDRLFRSSGLMRPKWDRKTKDTTYGAMTIQKALADVRETYHAGNGNRKEEFPPHPAEESKKSNEPQAPPAKPTHGQEELLHLTDLGNAERLVRLHTERIRFCPEHDKWYVWNGKIWELDKGKQISIYKYATDVVKTIYAEASKADTTEQRQILAKWARQCESKKRLADMVFLAARHPSIKIDQTLFDRDPFLLTCDNGILNLRTGELSTHRKSNYATKSIPICYDASATCPTFLSFLNKIMQNETGTKQDLVNFLQRAMGYTLSGDTSEECLFFLHGKGKNGKTTFVNVLSYMLGMYRQHLKIESFLTQRYDGIPNDIAQLPGVRLLTTSEIPEGRRLNESLVKDLTGGDEMSARFMRGEWFSFYPIFKLWMFGNHKPRITGTDEGIWRRIRLIPFTVTIPESERIPRRALETALFAEASGILAWMVQGCLKWQDSGLQEPPEVLEATKAYREEMDELADFFEEYCDIGYAYSVTTKHLYATYLEWCHETAIKPDGKIKFNRKVEERFQGDVWKERGNRNQPIWQGIRVKLSELREETHNLTF